MSSGPPYWTVQVAVVLCWVMFAAGFAFVPRTGAREQRRDRVSQIGILIQSAAYFLAYSRPWFPQTRRPPDTLGWPLSLLAVALALGSSVLAFLAVRALGRNFGLTARVLEGHRLITSGPYALVRNPIYTAMFGMLIASSIVFAYWPLALVAMAMFYWGTMIRIRSEERVLRAQFGEEFDRYAAVVPALVPRPWAPGGKR